MNVNAVNRKMKNKKCINLEKEIDEIIPPYVQNVKYKFEISNIFETYL